MKGSICGHAAAVFSSISMINSLVHLLSFMIWICRTAATFFEETFLWDKQSNFTVSSILFNNIRDVESSSKKAVLGQKVVDKSNGSADSIDAVLKLEPLSCSYSKICFMTIILSIFAPIRLSNSSVSATVDSYVFHHSFCTFQQ
jgi:hypothetical protein